MSSEQDERPISGWRLAWKLSRYLPKRYFVGGLLWVIVLAFPANDFLWQEPGSNAEIKRFCSERFHTSFPLFAKISVKGRRIAPLYEWLTKESAFPGKIPWNFTKFLFAPDGRLVARFSPKTDPRSKEVTEQVEKLLPPTE